MKLLNTALCAAMVSGSYSQKLQQTMKSLHLSAQPAANVERIYRYVRRHVAYDWETYYQKAHRNSARDALCEKKASCLGSARLFKDMCTKAHISARIVKGKLQNEDHAWNIVRFNHQNYLVDTVQENFMIGQKSAQDYHAKNMKLAHDDLGPKKKNYQRFGYYQFKSPKTIQLNISYDASSEKMHITRTYWYANQKMKIRPHNKSCRLTFTHPGDYCITAMNADTRKSIHYYFMVY